MDKKWKRLSLKVKGTVIEAAEKQKITVRQLIERFQISKIQISNLIKEKDEIKRSWVTNANAKSKTVQFHKTEESEIDSMWFNWFCFIRVKNNPFCGIILQEEAKEIAEALGIMNLKASVLKN